MLVVVLLVLLIWLVLMGFLAVWTIWFQGYLYTEPVSQIYWRAPAAGSAIALFLIVWITLDYRAVKNNPDAHFPYGPLQETAPSIAKSDTDSYPSLFVPKDGAVDPNKEYKDNKKYPLVEYKLEKVPDARKGHAEYRHGETPLPSSPPLLIVVENGETCVFEPDLDANKHFKRESGSNTLLYRDKKGRVLTEGPMFERRSNFPLWRFLGGVFLNVFFLAIWFVCMWLLLRYQFWHAVGLALVLCAVMLLFIVEPVMGRAEKVVRDNLTAASVRPES